MDNPSQTTITPESNERQELDEIRELLLLAALKLEALKKKQQTNKSKKK